MLPALLSDGLSLLLALAGGLIACSGLRYFMIALSQGNENTRASRPLSLFMYTSLVWSGMYISLTFTGNHIIWEFYAWLTLLLVCIDSLFFILPRVIIWLLGVLGIYYQIFCMDTSWSDVAISALSSYLIMAFFFYGYFWLTRKTGLGYGDVRLTVALGIWVGYESLPWLLMLAALFALLYITTHSIMRKKLLHICPFGPFLCLSSSVLLIYSNIIT